MIDAEIFPKLKVINMDFNFNTTIEIAIEL